MKAKHKFSELNPMEAITLLTELGDGETVSALTNLIDEHPEYKKLSLNEIPDDVSLTTANWRGTEHTYGYIQPSSSGANELDISFASTIEPDNNLKGKKINI